MEEAKNFYERKKRFLLSDEKLSQLNSIELSQANVSIRIALNKLPEEIQSLVHQKTIGVTAAYELSRLAFDVAFPNPSASKSVKIFLKKNPKLKWDFMGEEPKKWTEKRLKLQLDLAKRFIKRLNLRKV